MEEKLRITIPRAKALKRDNYSCKLCGEINNLQVHHMIPISLNGSNNLDNLITLCEICHHFMHCNPKHSMLLKWNHSDKTKLGCKNAWNNGKLKGRPKKEVH